MDEILEKQLSEEYRELPISMEDYSYPKSEEESEGEQWQDDVSIVEDRDRITPKGIHVSKVIQMDLSLISRCKDLSLLFSDSSYVDQGRKIHSHL